MGAFHGRQPSPPFLREEGEPPDITLIPRHHPLAGETWMDLSSLIVQKKTTSDPISALKTQSRIQMLATWIG